MKSFKRDLKGYWQLFVIEALLAVKVLMPDPIYPWLRQFGWLLIGINTALLIRFVVTKYLIINDTQLTIKGDWLASKSVAIADIRQIRFATGSFGLSKIETKNGKSISIRQTYLSSAAKEALLDLVKSRGLSTVNT